MKFAAAFIVTVLIGIGLILTINEQSATTDESEDNIENTQENSENTDTDDETQTREEVNTSEEDISELYDYRGELFDVTQGATIRGITTNGNGTGTAQARFENGQYRVEATIVNVPDPVGTDFYEGWVVRNEPFAFVSTGILAKEGDQYKNIFESLEDYTAYDFYVLTLEPDDGDPAPADHIVEGTMFPVSE